MADAAIVDGHDARDDTTLEEGLVLGCLGNLVLHRGCGPGLVGHHLLFLPLETLLQ